MGSMDGAYTWWFASEIIRWVVFLLPHLLNINQCMFNINQFMFSFYVPHMFPFYPTLTRTTPFVQQGDKLYLLN